MLELALLFLGIIAAPGVIIKIAVRAAGVPRQFCANCKASRFEQLSVPQQGALLLQYFRHHEGRDPDRSAMFACQSCMTVYDDFSGEKRSMDIDALGVVARSFCKVCNQLIQDCNPSNSNIECTRSGTRFQVHEKSGFRILMPPAGATILHRCRNVGGIA